MIERVFPAGDAHAPFVARFQSRETPLRMRRDQVVPIEHGKIQKLLCDLNADSVLADIFRTCSTKAVTVESGHRVATTTFQFCSQNIRRHKQDKELVSENFTEGGNNANSCQICSHKSDCQKLERIGSLLHRRIRMRAQGSRTRYEYVGVEANQSFPISGNQICVNISGR